MRTKFDIYIFITTSAGGLLVPRVSPTSSQCVDTDIVY